MRQLRQRAGVAHLDLLGLRGRRAQQVRDVVGDLVAGDRQRGGMADRALHEHRDVGGAGADVDQHTPSSRSSAVSTAVLDGDRRRDQVVDLQAAAIDALGDVLRRRSPRR